MSTSEHSSSIQARLEQRKSTPGKTVRCALRPPSRELRRVATCCCAPPRERAHVAARAPLALLVARTQAGRRRPSTSAGRARPRPAGARGAPPRRALTRSLSRSPLAARGDEGGAGRACRARAKRAARAARRARPRAPSPRPRVAKVHALLTCPALPRRLPTRRTRTPRPAPLALPALPSATAPDAPDVPPAPRPSLEREGVRPPHPLPTFSHPRRPR